MAGCVVSVKPMDAQTVLLRKFNGKHQFGRTGRDECL